MNENEEVLDVLEEMSPEELDAFDCQYVHSTAPSVNFVTNTVGCLIVAEAVKLLTGSGCPVLYPKYLEFDLFHYRMAVRSSNSLLDPANIKRGLSVLAARLTRLKMPTANGNTR